MMPSGALPSPIGTVIVEADASRLTRIRIAEKVPVVLSSSPLVEEALAQLRAWFDARLIRFDLPLAPAATPRGAILRQAIAGIEHGATATYGMVAAHAASSARAVGQACARNPFPIVIPCHRITGGRDIGFYSAGDGVRTKYWLLAHERGSTHG